MNYTVAILAMAMAVAFGFTSNAKAESAETELAAARSVALRCAVQTYFVKASGRTALGPIRSQCDELQVEGYSATVDVDGAKISIELEDSENSDGGDLNDVYLVDASGAETVLARKVPAFGDPIYAILGQDAEKLPRVLDSMLGR